MGGGAAKDHGSPGKIMKAAKATSLLLTLFVALSIPCAALAQDRDDAAARERARLYTDGKSPLSATDPEFAKTRDNLILGQIWQRGELSEELRVLVTIVTKAALGSSTVASTTEAALNLKVDPVKIKEAIYQATPYIGYPRAEDALAQINTVFEERGIRLPLEGQGTVTEETRFKEGVAMQKRIFGSAGIDAMHKNTPKGQEHISIDYLSAWCFGDTYTRKVLDLKTRELLTFVAISALGGCEPQVKSHVQGNLNVGNTRQQLVEVLAVMNPYIGFPRTLNALGCVNAVAK